MSNKKIVLIYTGITESGFNNPAGNEGTWINHGLCLISAALKKKGHYVDLIDLRRLKSWSDFEIIIKEKDFDIVGLTMMSVDCNPVIQCIDIIKQNKPNVKVIVGGPHPSICPEELIPNKKIDYIFIGEAEISIVELLRKLENGQEVERIIYGEQPNLDELTFADRDLFSLPEEPFVPFLKKPFVTIIAGRGCVYNCSYCQPAERMIFGNGVRRRSVSNVIEELKYLHKKFKFNSIMIHDDCLTEDKEWVTEFCKEYRRAGFGQPFVCQSRPDLICKNRDMVKSLCDAGLALFIIGFESGSQRILNFLRKGCTVEQNLGAAEICHKFNIKIWANYMLGIPTETKEEQRKTVDMIKKIKPYHCSPAYYTPHPGSRLFDYCQENDLSLIKRPEDYRRNTYEPKIKGIDYDYLKKILYESVSVGEDVSGKRAAKKAVYFLLKIGILLKLREILFLEKVKIKFRLIKRIIKTKLMFLTNSKGIKKIVLLSQRNMSDPSATFVNMKAPKRIFNVWSACSVTNDAQVYLYNDMTNPFDASIYRYVQFYLYSDSPGQGHFVWWLTDGRWQSGKHFSIQRGWKRYCFDMKNMPTYGASCGSDIKWEGLVCRLRLDPSEKEGVLTRIKQVTVSNLALIESAI